MLNIEAIRTGIEAAKRVGVLPQYVLAIITVESHGNPWAWNPEPKYRFLWNVRTDAAFRKLTAAEIESEIPPFDFPAPAGADRDAEYWGQSASWGLMQVMGAVAREDGYTDPFLTGLCDPLEGATRGTRHFAGLMGRYGKAESAIAAYNAGSPRYLPGGRVFVNQGYVDKVLAAVEYWRVWFKDNPQGPPA